MSVNKTVDMHAQEKKVFWLFVLFTSMHMLVVTWGFFQHAQLNFSLSLSLIFNLITWVSYSILYTLIALFPVFFLNYLPYFKLKALSAIVLSSFALLFIGADLMIYDLYNFHFNGFIWNLITTKGGLSSLGGGNDTYLSVAISAAITIAIQCGLWLLSSTFGKYTAVTIRWQTIAYVLLPLLTVQFLIYGISDIKNIASVLDSAQSYPFYKKITFRSFAEKVGIVAVRTSDNKFSIDTARLKYPLSDMQYTDVQDPPNIVIIAIESLRWDRLSPEIMPNTWRLAQKAQYFKQHYSGGNGTREGLFGLFYGLYGSYWSSFLHAERSPLLMDRIQALGYQLDIRTSARFSYPEFNKTLFSKVPLSQLHEEHEGKKPWERDQDNASELIKFVETRDKTKPFMSFFFLESTHARYDFPETNIIAQPYLKDVNYWGMSRQSLAPKIGELKNRYTNASHWVDIQLGRIYDNLERQGLLDNTIIVVTGDHGEEFLEKGFWGHNSSFVEEQTHVPMVMWMPGIEHREIDRVTSHLDICTTLLQILGASKNSQSYSLGANILDVADRKFIVVSDWHSISVMTNDMKYRIPYVSKGLSHWQPTGQKDEALSSEQSKRMVAANQAMILEAIKNSSKFLSTKNK